MKDALAGHVIVQEIEPASSRPRVTLTEEDVLDKIVLGLSAIFGLQEDTHLTGNQYSIIGCIAPAAQLAWQPFSSILIVKVRPRLLMPAMVLGWGIAQAGCLPLFSIITAQWYRRSEQPARVAVWYSTHGPATIVAALLSYGLGHAKGGALAPWQWIYLVTGLLTIVTVPLIYWKLDDDVSSARFLTVEERSQALERLRANQSGSASRDFKWTQVVETFVDIKCYLFAAMSFAISFGAHVASLFGPLLLSSFGFGHYRITLLNIPFGVLQSTAILVAAWAASRTRWKSLPLVTLLVFILSGFVLLYVLPHGHSRLPGLLVGYYFLAFIVGCNNTAVSWILANTAGQTKRSAMMALFNAASSTGAIIGPLLFDSADAPAYRAGLRSTVGVYAAVIAVVLLQVATLMLLNKLQARRRVANGKTARIHDHSMEARYVDMRLGNEESVGGRAFADLTDRENDEFVYVY
ncbi:major facilitator superfamily domain-containing protein [Chaetomium strumarium]|uniref:Major facilitator superfamily domain-containing protein n=1 Tax=Chaetomium strumarium TaxID=1170767 RepID=A0AAJ0GU92_9PEZI|nr:major facilitator superfamily domain-containing protein [Chaetomium strumarium]